MRVLIQAKYYIRNSKFINIRTKKKEDEEAEKYFFQLFNLGSPFH